MKREGGHWQHPREKKEKKIIKNAAGKERKKKICPWGHETDV